MLITNKENTLNNLQKKFLNKTIAVVYVSNFIDNLFFNCTMILQLRNNDYVCVSSKQQTM